MIRKLYTILLIGLCLNLVACGDDNENIDPNASEEQSQNRSAA